MKSSRAADAASGVSVAAVCTSSCTLSASSINPFISPLDKCRAWSLQVSPLLRCPAQRRMKLAHFAEPPAAAVPSGFSPRLLSASGLDPRSRSI